MRLSDKQCKEDPKMAKKKVVLEAKVKGLIKGELKRFITIIEKYLPAGKEKKEILTQFEEVIALVEKAIG